MSTTLIDAAKAGGKAKVLFLLDVGADVYEEDEVKAFRLCQLLCLLEM
jgi:hypothetical protein